MIWLHPALLLGLLLTAVPVLLHLLMRAKPKKLVFPALRLIQNRKRTNVRRLRLRHLALLVLRMAVIAMIVVAVARPSLPATDYSLRAGDWLRLVLVGVGVTGTYFGLLTTWRRKGLAKHELNYRRAYLRAGVAVAGALGFALLVAWPYQRRISAAITQPTLAASEFLPVAAILVFDTSLSMQYQQESRTRLEVARDIAARHLGSLPRSSRVAICDTSVDAPIRFQSDMSAAVKRIAALMPQAVSRPLDDQVLAAIEAQHEDAERSGQRADSAAAVDLLREVYIFTDLATSAWRPEASSRLNDALTRSADVSVYLIDVGVSNPANLALTQLALSDQAIPRGGEATLRATLESTGVEPGERIVELHVGNDKGVMVKQDQKLVPIDPSAAANLSFTVRGTDASVLQGEVRILGSDPLAFDDVRSFTLQMEPPVNVLVVAESRSEAFFLLEALESLGKLRYQVQTLTPDKLEAADLSRQHVVCLINVSDPKETGWRALGDFVARGGSALVVLGDRIQHEAYLGPTAADLLPGVLNRSDRLDPPVFLDFEDLTHPMLKKFAEWGVAGLTSIEIRGGWSVTVPAASRDTAVIARYTHELRRPALVERAHGKGRAMMLTTSLNGDWNDLTVSTNVWFLPLVDQMLQHLARSSADVYNFTIGDGITVTLDPDLAAPAYLLRKPGLQQVRNEIPPGTIRLVIHDVDQLGNYSLTELKRGFSVNADAAESNLRRLTKDELDARLGPDRYSLARDIENLQRNVRAGRVGREALPLLALVLLAAFLGEHFIANRFYDSEPQPKVE